jgi:hypothetical protein
MIIKREAELIYDRFLPLYIWSYTEKKSLSFIFNRFSTPLEIEFGLT